MNPNDNHQYLSKREFSSNFGNFERASGVQEPSRGPPRASGGNEDWSACDSRREFQRKKDFNETGRVEPNRSEWQRKQEWKLRGDQLSEEGNKRASERPAEQRTSRVSKGDEWGITPESNQRNDWSNRENSRRGIEVDPRRNTSGYSDNQSHTDFKRSNEYRNSSVREPQRESYGYQRIPRENERTRSSLTGKPMKRNDDDDWSLPSFKPPLYTEKQASYHSPSREIPEKTRTSGDDWEIRKQQVPQKRHSSPRDDHESNNGRRRHSSKMESENYHSNNYQNNSRREKEAESKKGMSMFPHFKPVRSGRTQEKAMKDSGEKLPVEAFQEQLIKEIFSHQVMVISGDTGCGKSTYIPMYIYLHCQKLPEYADSKILCTQPRRMAAVGISQRVSSLIGENARKDKGKLIGYHVGRDCHEGPSTRILFLTSGILLQRLVHNEDVLDQYRFIILDEVHERDIDSDFIMIYLKSVLHKHPKTHLILMSATINTANLSRYFAKEAIAKINESSFDFNNQKKQFDHWDYADGILKMKKALRASSTRSSLKEEEEQRGQRQRNHERMEVEESKNESFDAFANYQTAGSSQSGFKQSWDPEEGPSKEEISKINQKMEEELPSVNRNEDNITNAGIFTIDNGSGSRFDRHQYMLDQLSIFEEEMVREKLLKNPELKIPFQYNASQLRDSFYLKRAHYIKEAIEISVGLIRWIHINVKEEEALSVKQSKGTVLVFCPGFAEIFYWIFAFREHIKQFGEDVDDEYLVIPLHSSNADEVQDAILQSSRAQETQKKELRKIIVATNIAESSITIPDAIYVIDFGLSKENFFDKSNFTEKLELCWASKASFKQRAGRVGRVNTGYIFHLVPSDFFEGLHEYVQTELLRSPLEKVVLRIKYMYEKEIEKKNELRTRITKKREKLAKLRHEMTLNAAVNPGSKDVVLNEIEKTKGEIVRKENKLKKLEKEFNREPKFIFCDPLKVLGRALEPPGHMNVASALENLLHTGCITQLVNLNEDADDNNAEYDYQITILGEVYRDLPCNIYVCKLILLGNLFDCYSECVSLAALIQSPKPLIRWDHNEAQPPSVRDKDYDYEVPSDHLKMLENFQIFEKHLKNLYELETRGGRMKMSWDEFLEDEREFHFYLCSLRKKTKKSSFLSEAQKIMKFDVGTGINIMETRWDLVRRMRKKNFGHFSHQLNIKEKEKRILIALAGAYFDQYLVAEYSSEKLRYVIRPETHYHSMSLPSSSPPAIIDDRRCIVIREHSLWHFLPITSKASEEMKSKNLNYKKYNMHPNQIYDVWITIFKREVMQKYGTVTQCLLDKTDIVVEFDKKTYQNAIRRLLHASVCLFEEQQRTTRIFSSRNGSERVVDESQRRRPSETRQPIRLFNDPKLGPMEQLEQDIKSVVGNFSDIFYKYEMKVSDLFYYRDVKIDVSSYSRIILPENGRYDNTQKVIVAQSFYENESRKVTAKGVSTMPTYHLMLPFLVMIFGVSIKLETDHTKQRYGFVVHKEKSIELDYIMTKENLLEINMIRTCLRSFYLRIKQNTLDLSLNSNKNIFEKIIKLLSTKRIRYLAKEKWMPIYEEDRREYLEQLKRDHCNPTKSSYIPFRPIKGSRVPGRRVGVDYEGSLEEDHDGCHFYENIQDIKLNKEKLEHNFSDEGSLTFYKNYVEKYLEWKDEQVVELDRFKKIISMNDAELLCGICGAELFDAKHLMEPSANVIFWKIADKAKLYLDELPEPIVQSQLSMNHRNFNGINKIIGYGCVRKHLIAISFDQNETKYLIFGVKLRLRFPDLHEREFNISDFNRESLLHEQLDRKRNVRVPDRIHCKICDVIGIPKNELARHMDSQSHRANEKSFFQVTKENFYD